VGLITYQYIPVFATKLLSLDKKKEAIFFEMLKQSPDPHYLDTMGIDYSETIICYF
jgi:hypothetical protein